MDKDKKLKELELKLEGVKNRFKKSQEGPRIRRHSIKIIERNQKTIQNRIFSSITPKSIAEKLLEKYENLLYNIFNQLLKAPFNGAEKIVDDYTATTEERIGHLIGYFLEPGIVHSLGISGPVSWLGKTVGKTIAKVRRSTPKVLIPVLQIKSLGSINNDDEKAWIKQIIKVENSITAIHYFNKKEKEGFFNEIKIATKDYKMHCCSNI